MYWHGNVMRVAKSEPRVIYLRSKRKKNTLTNTQNAYRNEVRKKCYYAVWKLHWAANVPRPSENSVCFFFFFFFSSVLLFKKQIATTVKKKKLLLCQCYRLVIERLVWLSSECGLQFLWTRKKRKKTTISMKINIRYVIRDRFHI